MLVDQSTFLSYSNDKDSMAQFRYWSDVRKQTPIWKRRDRAEAKREAEAATRRCIDAGLNWEELPKPPSNLKAPDRSNREPIGRNETFREEMNRLANRSKQGAQNTSDRQPGGLSGGSNVAAAAGAGLAGVAAYDWLSLGSTEPVHQNGDGSAWYEVSDGSLWFGDGGGSFFAWDGLAFFALAPDGFLYAVGAAGLYTWLADGSVLSPADDGQLHAVDQQGNEMLLGEDGSFYYEGTDGSFYTLGVDGAFYGIDSQGDYFAAPEGSGFSAVDWGADGAGFDGGDDGGWFDALAF